MIKYTRHGHAPKGQKSSTYESWRKAKQRCSNPNSLEYEWYGGRGIRMCDAWFNSFSVFLKDMGVKPKGHTIERINNDGDYTPENCKWATHKENCRNRRSNHWVEFNGESLCFEDFAVKYCTVTCRTLYYKVAQGWLHEEIIEKYAKGGKNA